LVALGEVSVARGSYHIGTSGWIYDHWKRRFYPEDLPQKKWLEHYRDHFSTVEINNSFYNLPEKKTFEDWRRRTGKDFIFSVKASRYITHMKKLKDPEEPVERFFSQASGLKEKMGPVLFQLPPRWKANPDRLRAFLKALPRKRRYTFEFRDESWWNDETYEILADFNAAFCIFELDRRETPHEVTADFVYIRLHGPEGAYEGSYHGNTLRAWAREISGWNDSGLDVYCYFDNDQDAFAVRDAKRLLGMLG